MPHCGKSSLLTNLLCSLTLALGHRMPFAQLKRRDFITLLCGASAWPFAVRAQQGSGMRRVGVLLPYIKSDSQAQARVTAFQVALQERGWDGGNVAFEFRYAEGQLDRLPALAADLVYASVHVILTAGTESTDAARKAATTIPIVMAAVGDPIAAGFIASLARPGANVTGASLLATELTAKRLELLKEVLPALTRLAVLWSANNASVMQKFKQIESAAPLLGVQLQALELRAPSDIEKSFASATQFGAEAVMTTEDAIQITYRARLVDLAKRQRIPVASEFGEFARAGALMSYGPSILDSFRHAAGYIDKILKGAKPADLPVEQPTRFELIINLNTARALGLAVPPVMLGRADEVIE
jgi:putative ABC transport system substrate-binding protein